jgi:soluble lytic murein transglycosylase-like protein
MDALEKLARETAARQGLDPALVCAICEQETHWNPWLTRYESVYHNSQVVLGEAAKFAPRAPYTVSIATETICRCLSWGLMQVMGQTAREIGYRAPLAQLCDPAAGLEWGCQKLGRCLVMKHGDVRAAVALYNGARDPSLSRYDDEVLARMGKYQPPVVAGRPAVDIGLLEGK